MARGTERCSREKVFSTHFKTMTLLLWTRALVLLLRARVYLHYCTVLLMIITFESLKG